MVVLIQNDSQTLLTLGNIPELEPLPAWKTACCSSLPMQSHRPEDLKPIQGVYQTLKIHIMEQGWQYKYDIDGLNGKVWGGT